MRNIILICLIIFVTSCGSRIAEPLPIVDNENGTDSSAELLSFHLLQKLSGFSDSVSLTIDTVELNNSININHLYRFRQFLPAWIENFYPSQSAKNIYNLLCRAEYYGLDSQFYYTNRLQKAIQQLDSMPLEAEMAYDFERWKLMTNFELLMSNACFSFMNHIYSGVTEPDTLVYHQKKRTKQDFAIILSRIVDSKDVVESVLLLQPDNYRYRNLQNGLEKFLNNNAIVNKELTLPHYKRDSTACYQKADELLVHFGYLQSNKKKRNDSSFVTALKKFQIKNGLMPDGTIGKNTAKALVKNNYERLMQIFVNLERLRWERTFPSDYVYVNIPAFKLTIHKNKEPERTHNVVVGLPYRPTPEITNVIKYFITYPVWNVPYSIASGEILPKLKNDSAYLDKKNYVIYDEDRKRVDAKNINWNSVNRGTFNYKVMQNSGRSNSLGTIKFIFPNKHSVYLHDTPSKRLFNNETRAYSHGCVRLQEPVEFGRYLLEHNMQDTTTISIDTLMEKHIHKKVVLQKRMPIYLRYVTCTTDSLGDVIFHLDIYNKDEKLAKKMFNNNVMIQ